MSSSLVKSFHIVNIMCTSNNPSTRTQIPAAPIVVATSTCSASVFWLWLWLCGLPMFSHSAFWFFARIPTGQKAWRVQKRKVPSFTAYNFQVVLTHLIGYAATVFCNKHPTCIISFWSKSEPRCFKDHPVVSVSVFASCCLSAKCNHTFDFPHHWPEHARWFFFFSCRWYCLASRAWSCVCACVYYRP